MKTDSKGSLASLVTSEDSLALEAPIWSNLSYKPKLPLSSGGSDGKKWHVLPVGDKC